MREDLHTLDSPTKLTKPDLNLVEVIKHVV